MRIYFKSIRAINPAQNIDDRVNVLIEDGMIVHFSSSEANLKENTLIIDNKNLVLSPGFFDISVNFNEPGYEHNETIQSGCNAAANGGFTGVMLMPSTNPLVQDISILDFIRNRAKDNAVDVEIAATASQDKEGKLISAMMELHDAGVLMFTDYPYAIQSPEMLRRAFDYAVMKDSLIGELPFEQSLSGSFSMNESPLSYKLGLKGMPAVAEEMIVSRDIRLANYLGNRRLHLLQISTAKSLKIVQNAKEKGSRVSVSVTPYHLDLNESYLNDYNPNYKISLPLRAEEDNNALIEGIKNGLINCITSDHRPFANHLKNIEFENSPFGISGLETAFSILHDNLVVRNNLELSTLINCLSVNPRKILNLEPVKFSIGDSANFTIFDIDEELKVDTNKFRSASTNNPYNGKILKGKIVSILNNGKYVESKL